MDDEKIKRLVVLLFFTFLESSTCLPVFNETNEDIDSANGENSSLSENYTCMALHKCDHYSKLFDDIMSETQKENVLQFYNRISCEFEDMPENDLETSIYKVKCPIQNNDKNINAFIEALSTLNLSNLTNSLLGSTGTKEAKTKCIGSLTIEHEDDEYNIGSIDLDGPRTKYPNLRHGFPILRRTTVSKLTLIGNCCWEIYERSQLKGEKEIIHKEVTQEGTFIPNFQPVSIRRTEC